MSFAPFVSNSLASSNARAFISYARIDGETFARQLSETLTQQNVPNWLDRFGMEGGRDWWLQIKDALNKVEFLVLVMTRGAMESKAVREEWDFARQCGVCVYPVKAGSKADFDSLIGTLPRRIRDKHFYDLGFDPDHLTDGPEWQKFINDLRTRCTEPRVPFMGGDKPTEFVQRPTEFDKLITALLDEKREEPKAITAALRGTGGYGKSSLARALCHDERIREAYDDGVLWVTLGEKVDNLIGKIDDLIYMLSGQRSEAISIETAVAVLTELLADRDILMVIDDVWDKTHLKPFLQGGKRCARLITTRNNDTLPSGIYKVPVDAMRPAEAVELLRQELPSGEDDALNGLAKRLGGWALLLKLVNRVLRQRINVLYQPLDRAIRIVNGELDESGLTAFDAENPTAWDQAVKATLEASLKTLSNDDHHRYQQLAIFPEDSAVPLATLQKLWAMTESAANRLVTRLYELSLLLDCNLYEETIRLHDVIRAYLIHKRASDLPTLHSSFLTAYGLDHWTTLPADEPYLWRRLAYHLVKAARTNELYDLLLGSRHWLDAKFTVFATDESYVADLDLALNEIRDPLTAETSLLVAKLYTARQMVNARNVYSDANLKTLVWLGLKNKAVEHARLRTGHKEQGQGLIAIFEAAQDKGAPDGVLLEVALKLADPIEDAVERQQGTAMQLTKSSLKLADPAERVSLLCAIASKWVSLDNSRSIGIIQEALEISENVEDETNRINSLSHIAMVLQILRDDRAVRIARQILNDMRTIGWNFDNQDAGLEMIGILAQSGDFDTALDIAHGAGMDQTTERDPMGNPVRDAAIRRVVVELAHAEHFDAAIRVSSAISSNNSSSIRLRGTALGEIALAMTQVTDSRSTELFGQALEIIQTDDWDLMRAIALGQLASLMIRAGDERASDVLEEARTGIASIYAHLVDDTLQGLSSLLAQTHWVNQALEVANGISGDKQRAIALGDVALSLAMVGDPRASDVLNQAVSIALEQDDKLEQSKAIGRVCLALVHMSYFEQVPEVMRFAESSFNYNSIRSDIAIELGKAHQFTVALTIAREITAPGYQSQALGQIAVELAKFGDDKTSDDIFNEAILVARSAEDKEQSTAWLRDIIAFLAQAGKLDQARELVDDLGNSGAKSTAWSNIAISLAHRGQLGDALQLLNQVGNPHDRSWAFSSIGCEVASMGMPQADDLFSQALATAQKLDDWSRPSAMSHLVSSLIRAGRLDQAQTSVNLVEDNSVQAVALGSIALKCAKGGDTNKAKALFEQATNLALAVEDGNQRSVALRNVAFSVIQTGQTKQAFEILGPQNINDFLSWLANCVPLFDQIQAHLGEQILGEAIRIIAWARSKPWQQIYELLAANNGRL